MPAYGLRSLLPSLPKVLTRKDVQVHFGHLISPGYLANLDSKDKGPRFTYIGRKVVYRSDDFIAWLEARQSDEPA